MIPSSVYSLLEREAIRRGLPLPIRSISESPKSPQLSLKQFMLDGWHVLEPSTPFIDNWHIDAISEHLEACSRGQIRNLIINIPPRCEKSLLVSVFWCAWEWTWAPHIRWLTSSYSASLSTRDNLKCRRLIQSPWYQREFGKAFQLTSDQNVKMRFDNDRTGYRIATSVGGIGTGEGGDRILADDPHNVQEGESEAVRESTLSWWFETMSTRGNDPETAARVIIMQRVNERDLSGACLARRLGYEHLCLPMRYENTRQVWAVGKWSETPTQDLPTAIGFTDPRSQDGELLWPARFTEDRVTELEESLGQYASAGQLQQRPTAREGGMFKLEWFAIRRYSELPKTRFDNGTEVAIKYMIVRYWDKAGTEGGTGARSAGVLMMRSCHPKPQYILVDVKKGRWSAGQRECNIKLTAEADREQYGPSVVTWMEQEPGSGGKESAQNTLTNLAGYQARAETVTGDKEIRAGPFATQCEAQNVWIVDGPWVDEYLSEVCGFPGGALKDQVDASSGAFNKLAAKRAGGVA